jgi:hypothetical protein
VNGFQENCVQRANAGGVLRAVPIRGLFHTAWAHRVIPCLAQKSVAIGGGADMDDRAAMDDGDVNDPSETSASISFCSSEAGFSLQNAHLSR